MPTGFVNSIASWDTSERIPELVLAVHRDRHLRRAYRKSERRTRLRLFCCALGRLLDEHLNDAERAAVGTAERFARAAPARGGPAAGREAVQTEFTQPWWWIRPDPLTPQEDEWNRRRHFRGVAFWCNAPNGDLQQAVDAAAHHYAYGRAHHLSYEVLRARHPEWRPTFDEARRTACDVFRDLFRNPFDPPTAWTPPERVRDWARAIDAEDERFAELPVLGDAVEEAGCDDVRLLAHLRSGGDHHPGCWAVRRLAGLGP